VVDLNKCILGRRKYAKNQLEKGDIRCEFHGICWLFVSLKSIVGLADSGKNDYWVRYQIDKFSIGHPGQRISNEKCWYRRFEASNECSGKWVFAGGSADAQRYCQVLVSVVLKATWVDWLEIKLEVRSDPHRLSDRLSWSWLFRIWKRVLTKKSPARNLQFRVE